MPKINKEEHQDSIITSPLSSNGEVTFKADKREIAEKSEKEIQNTFKKKGSIKYSDKYKKLLLAKAKEDPNGVEIETPQGWMTVGEAIKKGYNPETGQFDKETSDDRVNRIIGEEGLGEEEAGNVRNLLMNGGKAPEEGAPQEAPVLPGAPVMPEGEEQPPADAGANVLAALGGGM